MVVPWAVFHRQQSVIIVFFTYKLLIICYFCLK